MTESTAVATTNEVEEARRRGRSLVAHKKEVNELFKTIEGMEWGTGTQAVKGAQFSEQTRYALAKFCQVTGANIMTQVDILGGKPYLNADYWAERIITDPLYVDMIVRSITVEAEESLRAKAKDNRDAYNALRGSDAAAAGQHLSRALRLEEEADYIAEARVNWNPPKWASCAYEVEIRRFMNAAPMDAIREGRVPMEEADKWIISVKEANWAGNRPRETKKKRDGGSYSYDPDPVGNAEPEKTARTRAMRRCAIRAFPAWREEYEAQVERAEKMIEAEFEIVQEDNRQQAAAASGPQAVSTAAGEPEATSTSGARPLPVDGEEDEGPDVEIVEDDEPEAPEEPVEPFDRRDAQKRLFATLNESGIKGDARKKWAVEQGFPESTKVWAEADFERAQEILVGPVRDRVMAMVMEQDVDLEDLSLRVINQREADYLVHWKALESALNATAPAATEEEGDL